MPIDGTARRAHIFGTSIAHKRTLQASARIYSEHAPRRYRAASGLGRTSIPILKPFPSTPSRALGERRGGEVTAWVVVVVVMVRD